MYTVSKKNQDLFGSLLNTLLNDNNLGGKESNPGFTVPSVNIQNNKAEYVLQVAAPGLNKEDFSIEVEENTLKLSVDKTVESEEKLEKFSKKEFNYLKFQRKFTLPKNTVDTEKIQATYLDGILTITLPKYEEAKETVTKISVG